MPDASTRPPKKAKKKARIVEQRGTTEVAVRSVVARHAHLEPDALTGDLSLSTDLGIKRKDNPALLLAMGEALDARFPDDFLDGIRTYADLTTAVRVSLSPQ